ncbi:flagellar hook protein [Burkholderiales bacterium]|nr:flagellar hook protein [Burkholderiales bacterium]
MGFAQALSGLNAASQNLDNIGNNIANASTIGFKEVSMEFADVYATSLWGSTANQIGIGVQVAAVTPQFTQGNITTTGNPLDIAINGNGFFQIQNQGITTYSRDGEFSLNANGEIVNSAGLPLLGYPANAGTITSAPPAPMSLSQAPVPPSATTTAGISLNLNSSDATIAVPFNMADPTTYNSSTSMTVYDSLGDAHTLSMYFAKTAADTWNVYASVDGTVYNGGAALETLTFNSSGQLSTGVSATQALAFNVTTGAAPMNVALTLPYASTSQYGSAFAVSSNTQNGYATGQLSGFSIGTNGTISGQYTNGQTLALGQIALANFANPQGLLALGGNQFAQSQASGAPIVGAPGSGSLGSVQSGALESSTVNITTELVNMITAQRAYQANAETVKTEDQVQQTLMNLR